MGDLVVDIVTCTLSTATAPDGSTITSSTCLVTVPAPGFALVFLTQSALDESDNAHPTETFATTAYTKAHNTLTVDPSVLATSNGQDATVRKYLGSTSFGTAGGAVGVRVPGVAVYAVSMALGVGMVLRRLV